MDKIEIVTSRFILKTLSEDDDLNNYLKWMRDSESNKYILDVRPSYELSELKDYIFRNNESGNAFLLGIFDKANFKHIGNIKFHNINQNEHSCFFGVLIGESDYRRIGVASEVITKVFGLDS